MLSRPKDSYRALTGLKGKQVLFLNCPSAPGMSPGRSDAASEMRAKLKLCSNWRRVVELVETAKAEGKLEASVFGAAMQVCGNQGWWEGLVELRRLQRKEHVTLFSVERSIALTALAHCLKLRRKHLVVPERVPIALGMAKQFWIEAEPATDALAFNCSLGSALKLATCLDRESAYKWGLEVWSESEQVAFPKNHVTLGAYVCFLEHYQECDKVDALLEGQDEVFSQAMSVVLLGSLLNCSASRCDWQRAEALWGRFTKMGIVPNEICHATLAKAYLLAGRPAKGVEVLREVHVSSAGFIMKHFAIAKDYAQALLLTCHASMEPDVIKRTQSFLVQATEHAPKGHPCVKHQLLKMKSVLEQLLSKPQYVRLRDVLIEWKAKEQSVMAKWENFPAGSNYFENKPSPRVW